MTSPRCLAKQACLPLGGQSVWAIAGHRDTRPIVLVATALDAVTEFYEENGDALNAGIRIAVLLAIVDALRQVALDTSEAQLMVAFFQGEALGRAGSRFFLADLQDFQCLQEVAHSQSPFNDRLCSSPLRVRSSCGKLCSSRLLSRSSASSTSPT